MEYATSIKVDDTELQMLYEAVRRVKPFADMHPEMAEAERKLEQRLELLVEELISLTNAVDE